MQNADYMAGVWTVVTGSAGELLSAHEGPPLPRTQENYSGLTPTPVLPCGHSELAAAKAKLYAHMEVKFGWGHDSAYADVCELVGIVLGALAESRWCACGHGPEAHRAIEGNCPSDDTGAFAEARDAEISGGNAHLDLRTRDRFGA
jgi:hypothetical protein